TLGLPCASARLDLLMTVPPRGCCDGSEASGARTSAPEEDSLSAEAVLDREQGRAAARLHADLGVDVLGVVIDGLRRNAERAGDLLHRLAARDCAQHVDLAFGQAGDQFALDRDAMTRRGKDGGDRVGVETARAHLAPELFGSRVRR